MAEGGGRKQWGRYNKQTCILDMFGENLVILCRIVTIIEVVLCTMEWKSCKVILDKKVKCHKLVIIIMLRMHELQATTIFKLWIIHVPLIIIICLVILYFVEELKCYALPVKRNITKTIQKLLAQENITKTIGLGGACEKYLKS